MSANNPDTQYAVCEMYFEDGMKEAEIAESLGLSLLEVNEILAAYENGEVAA